MSYDKLSLENWIELVNSKDEEIAAYKKCFEKNVRIERLGQIAADDIISRQAKQLKIARKALNRIKYNGKNPSDIAGNTIEKMNEFIEYHIDMSDEKQYSEKLKFFEP
jgi:hypothetical protein